MEGEFVCCHAISFTMHHWTPLVYAQFGTAVQFEGECILFVVNASVYKGESGGELRDFGP